MRHTLDKSCHCDVCEGDRVNNWVMQLIIGGLFWVAMVLWLLQKATE